MQRENRLWDIGLRVSPSQRDRPGHWRFSPKKDFNTIRAFFQWNIPLMGFPTRRGLLTGSTRRADEFWSFPCRRSRWGRRDRRLAEEPIYGSSLTAPPSG